jgi:hypothetical protein
LKTIFLSNLQLIVILPSPLYLAFPTAAACDPQLAKTKLLAELEAAVAAASKVSVASSLMYPSAPCHDGV